jgi:hypothetical protein
MAMSCTLNNADQHCVRTVFKRRREKAYMKHINLDNSPAHRHRLSDIEPQRGAASVSSQEPASTDGDS